MTACCYPRFDHPIGVVFDFVSHLEGTLWVFDDHSFEDGSDVAVYCPGCVSCLDHFPDVVVVGCGVVAGED